MIKIRYDIMYGWYRDYHKTVTDPDGGAETNVITMKNNLCGVICK